MGYVAVRGGKEAIEESLKLLEWERVRDGLTVDIEALQAAFPDLIDQVMSESSLYAPQLAALALKQAQGSPEEAVFLLRAFRSTLERPYVSRIIDTNDMRADRRISAAFKDVPGGQVLGATRDYSHRLLNFKLLKETDDDVCNAMLILRRYWKRQLSKEMQEGDILGQDEQDFIEALEAQQLPKVSTYLRNLGLLVEYAKDNSEPKDITTEALTFPAARSVRLQTLTRGMCQAVTALGYAAIRGFGPAHPTVCELRHGQVDIAIDDIAAPGDKAQAYYVGALPVTEVESLFTSDTTNSADESELSFSLGYGMVMGRGETKAIAMSVLDNCLDHPDKRFPTQDEEFVLYHVDGVEATGFISHLKLPHYVTFQSKLSSVRKTREESPQKGDAL